jgi:hypothetical protein
MHAGGHRDPPLRSGPRETPKSLFVEEKEEIVVITIYSYYF